MKGIVAMEDFQNIRGLNEKQAAQYIGFSSQYLRASRLKNNTNKEAPPFIKIGGRVLYLKDDLDQWLESYQVEKAV